MMISALPLMNLAVGQWVRELLGVSVEEAVVVGAVVLYLIIFGESKDNQMRRGDEQDCEDRMKTATFLTRS